MKSERNNQEKKPFGFPREHALMSLANTAGVSTIPKILGYLEDMDKAINFMIQWQTGTVLGLEPGQRIDRWAATLRVSERAGRDVDFKRELLRNPRYFTAITLQECYGIKPIDFLWQVDTVRIVEEMPGLHWLILPACHLGCATLEGKEVPESTDSCSMCGKPQGKAGACVQDFSSATTPVERIHQIDEFIVRSVIGDASSRARLLADPSGFFAQSSQTLFGVLPQEEFGIQEVKVVSDTDTLLYVVLLASHRSIPSKIVCNQTHKTITNNN